MQVNGSTQSDASARIALCDKGQVRNPFGRWTWPLSSVTLRQMDRSPDTGSDNRRRKSSTKDLDEEAARSYQPLLEEALSAFARDHSYAAQMAKSAVTITTKRALWAARTELKAAEADAREQCAEDSDRFVCIVADPCGTGRCPFASFEMSRIVTKPKAGSKFRPRRSTRPLYDLETAVQPWLALRKSAAQ